MATHLALPEETRKRGSPVFHIACGRGAEGRHRYFTRQDLVSHPNSGEAPRNEMSLRVQGRYYPLIGGR